MDDIETLQELMASVYLTPRQKEALGRLVARTARTNVEMALLGACRRASIVVGAPEEFLAEASEREIREAIEALRVAERRPRTGTCPAHAGGMGGCVTPRCGECPMRRPGVEAVEDERQALLGPCGAE